MERTIDDLLAQTEQRVGVCETFALLWLASAGDELSPDAYDYFARQLEVSLGAGGNIDVLLEIIAANDLDSFLVACRVLKREMNSEEKHAFLDTAISVATVHKQLTISANHILRLFNDLLGFTTDYLNERFTKISGCELPEPGDPSSILWWEMEDAHVVKERFAKERFAKAGFAKESSAKESSAKQSAQQGRGNYEESRAPGKHFSRAEAFAVLGLDHEASHGQIKKAYRRLAQSYHPDRHEHLGADARGAAALNFLRVRQAYEVLKQ